MANIEEKVESLVKNKIEKLGFELYDVQYVKEGQDYYLRIFIEKPEGVVDLNDCEKVNNEINDLLDTADYIKEQYFLEISSTGLEKILRKDKHLKANIGNMVKINLFKPIELQKEEKQNNKKNKGTNKKIKEIDGKLEKFNDESIIVELEDSQKISIERKNISLIKTIFDWESI